MEILKLEAEFEPETRALVRSVNERLSSQPTEGEFWVRLRPPTSLELENGSRHPALVKFYRVASLVQVSKVLVDFVEVSCASHTMLFMLEEFIGTFVRVNYWPGHQSDATPSSEPKPLS